MGAMLRVVEVPQPIQILRLVFDLVEIIFLANILIFLMERYRPARLLTVTILSHHLMHVLKGVVMVTLDLVEIRPLFQQVVRLVMEDADIGQHLA
jgi:hypothetical protein